MTNQTSPPRQRRRGQKSKQRRGGERPSPLKSPAPKVTARSEAISQQIHRLDLAKRRIRLCNKVALVVAGILMSKNIWMTYQRRGGGTTSIMGEAFQSSDVPMKKATNPGWSLFGKRGTHRVPKEMLQPFGSYPNVLNITSEMRSQFHPVVKLPLRKDAKAGGDSCKESDPQRRNGFWPWQKRADYMNMASEGKMIEIYDYTVQDLTGRTKSDNKVLLQGGKRVPQLVSSREEAMEFAKLPKESKGYDIGRYDEDRRGGMLYTSSLFLGGTKDESSRRTIHMGLDIGAPVGTAVHAFTDGIVHSAGYNPDLGDYGHVVVVEHHLRNGDGDTTKVYALYGHLAAKGIKGKHRGQKIAKGQVIGYLGNTAENGGWTGTHVHFQLSVNPPETHDMPGVVTETEREQALLEYPDPRFVVGELY